METIKIQYLNDEIERLRYCGPNDWFYMPAYALRDTVIHVNDRICQFRIEKHQPTIGFEEVDHLNGEDRGGIGSTGKR